MCPLFHLSTVVWHRHLKVQFASSDRNTLSAYLGSYLFVFPFFSRPFFVPSLFRVCLCLLRMVFCWVGFVEVWVAAILLHRSLAGGLDRPCNPDDDDDGCPFSAGAQGPKPKGQDLLFVLSVRWVHPVAVA